MVWRAALALVLVASTTASAHGPHPAAVSIAFRQGHGQDIVAGTTFGMLMSHDGGATWRWMCETAIRYADNGTFNPDYAYTASGAVFATTRDDALVMRDGCSFARLAPNLPASDVSAIALGTDGSLHMAAVALDDAKIYASADDGSSFTSATAGAIGDWYSSLEVSATDPTRLYLAGFRQTTDGRAWQLYRSDDAGASYQPLPLAGLQLGPQSVITVVGIAAETVFVSVAAAAPDLPSALYRSLDAGVTWTKVKDEAEKLAFVLRANGDAVVATTSGGAAVSHDLGATWIPLANAPHVNCLFESPAGEVWACTENYGSMLPPYTPSDGAGIMKTKDLAIWTPVLRFQDIAGPIDCPVGTRQHDQCIYDCAEDVYNADPANCPNTMPRGWCALASQLIVTSDEISCVASDDPPAPTPPPEEPGCDCRSSRGGGPVLAGLVLVGLLSRRRRGQKP